MTTDALEERIRRDLASGTSEHDAAEILRSLGVQTRFVPVQKFQLNSLTLTLTEPPADSVGALVGSSKIVEKEGIFERFVVVVVYVDQYHKVSKVATKSLTVGP